MTTKVERAELRALLASITSPEDRYMKTLDGLIEIAEATESHAAVMYEALNQTPVGRAILWNDPSKIAAPNEV
jgi:hypothetical protein